MPKVDLFMNQLMFGTDNPMRVSRIPDKIHLIISHFRYTAYGLDTNPEDINILAQDAGKLVYYGQYGYVDLVNEHYTDLDKISTQVIDFVQMLKKDYFDEPLNESEPDYEWVAQAVDDVYSFKLYLEITDQWDTTEALEETNKVFNYMLDTCERIPEINDYRELK